MATTKTDPKLAITADRARKGKDHEGLTREKLIEAYRIMYTSRKIDDREILLKRQQKIYFQMSGAGHEAIGTARRVIDRPQHVRGRADVVTHKAPIRVLDREALACALLEVLVVALPRGHCLLEDRRVRGHAAHAVLVDVPRELARSDRAAPEVVHPHALPERGKAAHRVHRGRHVAPPHGNKEASRLREASFRWCCPFR